MFKYNNILRIPFKYLISWEIEKEYLISNWKRLNRCFITNILIALEKYPTETESVCKEILMRWNSEIIYQINNNNPVLSWKHIEFSINHPLLTELALIKAKEIIEYNFKFTDILPEELIMNCERIVSTGHLLTQNINEPSQY